MGFLKKLGQVLAKVGAVTAEVAGIPFVAQLLAGNATASAVTGKVLGDLNTLFGIVTLAEMAFADATGKSGPAKLRIAGPGIRAALLIYAASNLPGKGKIRDAAKVAEGADKVASGLAEFLEGLEPIG